MFDRRKSFEEYINSLNENRDCHIYHTNRVPENYPNIELRGQYISYYVAGLWDMWNGMLDFVEK